MLELVEMTDVEGYDTDWLFSVRRPFFVSYGTLYLGEPGTHHMDMEEELYTDGELDYEHGMGEDQLAWHHERGMDPMGPTGARGALIPSPDRRYAVEIFSGDESLRPEIEQTLAENGIPVIPWEEFSWDETQQVESFGDWIPLGQSGNKVGGREEAGWNSVAAWSKPITNSWGVKFAVGERVICFAWHHPARGTIISFSDEYSPEERTALVRWDEMQVGEDWQPTDPVEVGMNIDQLFPDNEQGMLFNKTHMGGWGKSEPSQSQGMIVPVFDSLKVAGSYEDLYDEEDDEWYEHPPEKMYRFEGRPHETIMNEGMQPVQLIYDWVNPLGNGVYMYGYDPSYMWDKDAGDLYEIDVRGLEDELQPDFEIDRAWYHPGPIPPERIKKVAKLGFPVKVAGWDEPEPVEQSTLVPPQAVWWIMNDGRVLIEGVNTEYTDGHPPLRDDYEGMGYIDKEGNPVVTSYTYRGNYWDPGYADLGPQARQRVLDEISKTIGVRTASPITQYHWVPLTQFELMGWEDVPVREQLSWRNRADRHNQRARKLRVSGGITGRELWALNKRFENKCAYCHRYLTWGTQDATLDHVYALGLGGSGGIENVVPACRACNQNLNEWDRRNNPDMSKEDYFVPEEFAGGEKSLWNRALSYFGLAPKTRH